MKFIFLFLYNFIENNYHLKRIEKFFFSNVALKKPIIFDVGSHKGKMTHLFLKIYKDANFYCFEPNKIFNKRIRKISKKIKLFNYALGKKKEVRKLYLNNIDLTNSLSIINNNSFYLKIKNFIIKNQKKKISKVVKVTTLKNFCNKHKIKKIDLLKIDVEGYEYKVLLGANTFIKNINYIILEIQKNDMYKNYSIVKIEKYLKKNNFKLIKNFRFPLMFFQDRVYKKI